MSLPIYKAISFNAILDKGGHSKPWVVMVDLEGVPKPYVVKLYKTIVIIGKVLLIIPMYLFN
ncbi:hypothetical protein EZS27_009931 [termite gut metagenome]|uniref:Uncharacterized protein n=1 Tax=termite gut metagenome TaxID=433724 RepID=A0A5J4S9D5_9ZZZZ